MLTTVWHQIQNPVLYALPIFALFIGVEFLLERPTTTTRSRTAATSAAIRQRAWQWARARWPS
ncbi:hypothetical protein FOY51_00670 [Antrihabitans cavernicola]|uniref:Uncharacterized protein n=1 Tax=Antrihabitans cavernicola TaxID=2495913 RepID=A0A5A7SIU1_9NOCA|nr:hypothetical protein FOY51_00670 [Spelaeibacter cavernicola]